MVRTFPGRTLSLRATRAIDPEPGKSLKVYLHFVSDFLSFGAVWHATGRNSMVSLILACNNRVFTVAGAIKFPHVRRVVRTLEPKR